MTALLVKQGAKQWLFWKCIRNFMFKVTQSCLTLCDPVDCGPPGSSIHGILQARILEWVAISFSRGSSQPRIEPRSPALQADSSSPGATREAPQARLPEWIAAAFSKGSSQPRDGTLLSCVSYIGSRGF